MRRRPDKSEKLDVSVGPLSLRNCSSRRRNRSRACSTPTIPSWQSPKNQTTRSITPSTSSTSSSNCKTSTCPSQAPPTPITPRPPKPSPWPPLKSAACSKAARPPAKKRRSSRPRRPQAVPTTPTSLRDCGESRARSPRTKFKMHCSWTSRSVTC